MNPSFIPNKPWLVVLLLTPVAVLIHGYQFAVHDQLLYIPFIYHTLDDSLYPTDYLFSQAQAKLEFFQMIFSLPVAWFGIESAMFGGYLVTLIAILGSGYLLARQFVEQRAAYLFLLFLLLPVVVAGSETRLYDNYLNPRTFTLPLLFLSLAALTTNRWPILIILNSSHLLIHPISALPLWLTSVLLLGWRLQQKRVTGPVAGVVLTCLVGVMGFMFWLSQADNPFWIDPTWRTILEERTSYLFLSHWSARDWLSLLPYLLLGIQGWRVRPRSQTVTALGLVITGLVLLLNLTSLVGVDFLGVATLVQLQLGRSWSLLILLALIFASDLIVYLWHNAERGLALLLASLLIVDNGEYLLTSLTLLLVIGAIWLIQNQPGLKLIQPMVGLVVIAALGYGATILEWRDFRPQVNLHLPFSNGWLSNQEQDWRDVQLWVAANTSPDSRFAMNPEYKGFRVYSYRSPIVEEKDGAPAMFNRAFALEWYTRFETATQVKEMLEAGEITAGLTLLQNSYPADYLIIHQQDAIPGLEPLYQNQHFIIYSAPSP